MPRTTCQGTLLAGGHLKALEAEDRILMPSLRDLSGLRHCCCWQERPSSSAMVLCEAPRLQFSPEENARLRSVYMRPWTLQASESTKSSPHVSLLGTCAEQGESVLPFWKNTPSEIAGPAQDAGTSPAWERQSIQVRPTEKNEKYSFRDIN